MTVTNEGTGEAHGVPNAETAEPDEGPARVRGDGAGLRWAAGIMLVSIAAFFGMGVATCAYRLTAEPVDAPETVTVVRPTPDVIVAVRDLARLESAEYHVERVIDLRDTQQRLFGMVEAEDAILLVAAGEVTAGVDLTKLRDGDVTVDPEAGEAIIVLPPPEILSTRLDNERTFVHSRHTDVLAKRSESLESRARREAERTLSDAALEGGILERARVNAAQTIRILVESLGYDRVEIRHADG